MTLDTLSAPWETLVFSLVLLVAPLVAQPYGRRPAWPTTLLAALLVATLFAADARLAYGAAAIAAVLHALTAWPTSRTGALWLGLSALLMLGTAVCLATGHLAAAFALSTLSIAIRSGTLPFHPGVASLCDRAPLVQTQQMASAIALVFAHLRFVDHHAEAVAWAPLIVRVGAGAAFAAALMSTVQKDLRGFFRCTTSVHGGMLLAAVGAASLHNYAAALLYSVSAGLGLGGLGIMLTSLQARAGEVGYSRASGRTHAFPRLATAFALFAAASVAVPGSVGFVADDLLLHALWMESPTATVLVILSGAMLAVSTLICYAHVFLGRPLTVLAPDLLPRERAVAAVLVVLIVLLGVTPGSLLYPADRFLSEPTAARTPAIVGGGSAAQP